jgi:hypothetical protein
MSDYITNFLPKISDHIWHYGKRIYKEDQAFLFSLEILTFLYPCYLTQAKCLPGIQREETNKGMGGSR